MQVTVELTGQIRSAAGRELMPLTLEAGATLGDLIAGLIAASPPAVRPHVVTADGRLQPTLVVVIDNQALPSNGQRELVPVSDGATVVLIPPVAGG